MAKNNKRPTSSRDEFAIPTVSKRPKLDNSNPQVKFYFFNVGQGECTLIQLPTGDWVLVDFGSTADWSSVRDKVFEQIISFVPAKRFEYVILTHPDSDHYNKIVGLLDKGFTFNNLYYSKRLEKIVTNINGEQVRIETDEVGESLLGCFTGKSGNGKTKIKLLTKDKVNNINFVHINEVVTSKSTSNNYIKTFTRSGPGGKFTNSTENRSMTDKGILIASSRLSPQDEEAAWEIYIMAGNVKIDSSVEGQRKNTASIVTLFNIDNGGKYVLLRGDATDATDEYLVSNYKSFFQDNIIDLGNIAHHGSNLHCNEPEYIEYLAPQTSILSCAKQNSMYKLPSLYVQQVYAVNQNQNLQIIEGFLKETYFNTSSQKYYWQEVLAMWDAGGIAYTQSKKTPQKPKSPTTTNGNVTDSDKNKVVTIYTRNNTDIGTEDYIDIIVDTDYNVYRKSKVNGQIKPTYDPAALFAEGSYNLYIQVNYDI